MKNKDNKQNSKILINGSYSILLTVLLLAGLIIVNLIVNHLPVKVTQFDFSNAKLYTLTDTTTGILKNLDQDVILGLFKKAWVENNPILKWILESMDEKTLKSAFGEWGKEKQFFDILKKYGITEYWCSKEFDPSEDITVGSVFLPTDDAAPALEIYDLYTRIDVCPDEYCPVTVTNGSKDSETFNIATNDLERREVN